MNADLIKINKNGWNLSQIFWNNLNFYEKSFLKLELSSYKTKKIYRSRIESIKFVDKSKILDAGCGFGQWSLIFSESIKKVYGIDCLKRRVKLANQIAKLNRIENCHFEFGNIEKTKFKDEYFDFIFCNGTIWFTNIKNTLYEFSRILKKKGMIYISYANFGWYFKLLIKSGFVKIDYNNFKKSSEMIIRFFLKKDSRHFLTKDYINTLIPKNLKIIHHDYEGKIDLTNKKKI